MTGSEVGFEELYGPWRPVPPTGVAELLGGFPGPWWIAGGWAIEAFTGRHRPHEDTDVALFRRQLPELRFALAGRFHLWSAGSGALRPVNDDFPEPHPDSAQVWLREHAQAPWVADVLLDDDRDGLWCNRRWPDHVAPLEDVTWVARDGVRYLNPEIVLLFKARLRRAKDEADLAAALPLLDQRRRAWLRSTLETVAPGHAWLARI